MLARTTTRSMPKSRVGSATSSQTGSLPPAMLTSDQSLTCAPTTSTATRNATSLQASAAGASLSVSPAGPTTEKSGPAPVRVSRFRSLEKEKAMPIQDTCGPLFTRSSPSAGLQLSLENSLRARMARNGSALCGLILNPLDMPAGPSISRLAFSVRRMSGKDSTLLPTPAAQNHSGSIRLEGGSNARKKWKKVGLLPTVTKRDERMDKWSPAYERRKSPSIDALSSKNGRAGMVDLAALAAWMMGYPKPWLNRLWAASATPSSRRSPRNSSQPTKKREARRENNGGGVRQVGA
jgi:hypothetical protein